ncbi:methyl-accepting chemotaxis protein [Thiorhodospira sibirica]|uniref:methyl-accepting chemotaxis protein n=1 Tax=Thiorhodospira sibirica TaxID=154347 RepID=UPI00022C5DC0|nr:methyl-accepting chemotaxis protein [Thiorhodospira sibirica]
MSLTRRLLWVVLLTGMACLLLGFVYVQWLRASLVHDVIEDNSQYLATILEERIKSKKEFGIGVSVMLAQHPGIREAFLQNDRPAAIGALNAILETYTTTTNYRGLRVQIHSHDGFSWLRSWAVDEYGDDLRFRPSIQRIMREQRPCAECDEMGRAGFAIRALAPIMEQGRYRGSLELLQGVGSISRDFERDGAAYILLLSQNALQDSPGVSSNRRVGEYIVAHDGWFNDHALNFARSLDLATLTQDGVYLGAQWFGVMVPLLNERGEKIGMHVIGKPAHGVRAEVAAATRSAWMFLGLIAVLVISMGILIAWMVQKRMVTPIRDNVVRIQQMEHAPDMRLQAEGRDELAVLFQAFNHYADNLQHILQQITETSLDLAAAAEQLLSHAHTGLNLVTQQQNESEQVASASVQMAASAGEMSGHAQHTQHSAEQALESADKGIDVVGETRRAIESLAANMHGMLESIKRLDQDSQSIGTVLQTITEISEQTNLLALNAAIEAARAGEHGRGFAVVADEVRRLASKTQNSTDEIYRIITQLQTSVGEVTVAIEKGQDETQRCVTHAQQASEGLDFIKQTVSDVYQQGLSISQSAHEQNHVADEVSQNILRINNLAEKNAQSAQQILAIATNLSKRAEALEALLKS